MATALGLRGGREAHVGSIVSLGCAWRWVSDGGVKGVGSVWGGDDDD
jgi:hypothetical protein